MKTCSTGRRANRIESQAAAPRRAAQAAPRPAWRAAGGFTLVEMLIVVAIIGVLASILMPMLGRARENSRRVACASNMRQLYLAAFAFGIDNDKHVPVPPYIGEDPKYVAWRIDRVQVGNFQLGTMMPYLSESVAARTSTMWCPSDNQETSRGAGSAGAVERNFSYSMNLQIRNGAGKVDNSNLAGTYLNTVRFDQVITPARKIIFYEEFGPNDGVAYGNGDSDDWISGRHGGSNSVVSMNSGPYNDKNWRVNGKSNQCFFDGHVELMTVQQYMADNSTYAPLK